MLWGIPSVGLGELSLPTSGIAIALPTVGTALLSMSSLGMARREQGKERAWKQLRPGDFCLCPCILLRSGEVMAARHKQCLPSAQPHDSTFGIQELLRLTATSSLSRQCHQ